MDSKPHFSDNCLSWRFSTCIREILLRIREHFIACVSRTSGTRLCLTRPIIFILTEKDTSEADKILNLQDRHIIALVWNMFYFRRRFRYAYINREECKAFCMDTQLTCVIEVHTKKKKTDDQKGNVFCSLSSTHMNFDYKYLVTQVTSTVLIQRFLFFYIKLRTEFDVRVSLVKATPLPIFENLPK